MATAGQTARPRRQGGRCGAVRSRLQRGCRGPRRVRRREWTRRTCIQLERTAARAPTAVLKCVVLLPDPTPQTLPGHPSPPNCSAAPGAQLRAPASSSTAGAPTGQCHGTKAGKYWEHLPQMPSTSLMIEKGREPVHSGSQAGRGTVVRFPQAEVFYSGRACNGTAVAPHCLLGESVNKYFFQILGFIITVLKGRLYYGPGAVRPTEEGATPLNR